MRQKAAIIGGGIAGLTAAYLLNSKFDITVFEKENRLGGNAYTHVTKSGEIIDIAVGSVNKCVSLNFLKLCEKLNVKMVRRPAAGLISLHNPDGETGTYLTPLNIRGLILQKFALFYSFSGIRVLMAMIRAIKMLDKGELTNSSVEDLLTRGLSLNEDEKKIFMAPLCVISSMYYGEVLKGPAEYFISKIKKLKNYNLLFRLVDPYFPVNFTKSYIDAFSSQFSDKVILNSNVERIKRTDGQIIITMKNGNSLVFDKLVFACNSDQALKLLETPTGEEKRILGAWTYKDVLMVVHKDSSKLPHRQLCQSWTCIETEKKGTPHFSTSYCSWLLSPGASAKSKYIITQHPNFLINEVLVDFKKRFRVPLYDFKSFESMKLLPSLNGKLNTYYCGSYFGYGLHGDAVDSAIDVANQMGCNGILDCDDSC